MVLEVYGEQYAHKSKLMEVMQCFVHLHRKMREENMAVHVFWSLVIAPKAKMYL